jgi:hypothetical protein
MAALQLTVLGRGNQPAYEKVPTTPFHETSLYLSTLAALQTNHAESPEMTSLTKASQGAQWFTLAWFIGVITTFTTEKLSTVANGLKLSDLNTERFLMGSAVGFITLGVFLNTLKRKKELDAIESLKEESERRTNTQLWGQAFSDCKMGWSIAAIAAVAVTMNTLEMVGPTAIVGASAVGAGLALAGGVLFVGIELLHVLTHAKTALEHTKHIKALEIAKAQNHQESNLEKASTAITADVMLSTFNKNNPEALKALTIAFRRMKDVGFNMNQSLTQDVWLEKAILTHRQERKFQVIKAVVHGTIAVGMLAAFALGHVFTFAAIGLFGALVGTATALGFRLGIAATPEKKLLKSKLDKKEFGQTATVWTKNPAAKKIAAGGTYGPLGPMSAGFNAEV